MQGQERRNAEEEIKDDGSSGVKEDIKKMLGHPRGSRCAPEKEGSLGEGGILGGRGETRRSTEEAVSLMKQLVIQYDEIEGYLKGISERTEEMKKETFPVELLSTLVQSSRVSPSLVTMVSELSEENKHLRKGAEAARTELAQTKEVLDTITASGKTSQLEMRYLEQTVSDAAAELRGAREDAERQRKKILELEAALEAQRKIAKELLREKAFTQKSENTHEEEKKVLKNLMHEKDEIIDSLKRSHSELEYGLKAAKRESVLLQIQNARLKKRADMKERALSMCNTEMEKLITQLDKITRMDTQKKEKLEYLKIIKKRLEYENRDLLSKHSPARKASLADPVLSATNSDAETEFAYDTDSGSASRSDTRPESGTLHRNEVGTKRRSTKKAIHPRPQDAPHLTEKFLAPNEDTASETETHSGSTNRTTTSFQEMKRKSDEINERFKELDLLLQEIKQGTETDLDRVEEKIEKATKNK